MVKKRFLGDTGICVSQVGMGVLPIGPGQLSLSIEEGAKVISYAIKQGINFLDTAQYYQTYPYIRRALEMLSEEGFPQNDLIICSKSLSTDYDSMMDAILQARESLNRDVIDIFLMHEVRTGQFSQRFSAWEALKDAKAAQMVRAIGISTHHVDVAEDMAHIPSCDVVFPILNYCGMGIRRGSIPGSLHDMEEAIKKLKALGKGVFAMKAFGGGNLTSNYQKALNYIFSQTTLDSVMVGFTSEREIIEILSYLDGTMDPNYQPDISMKRVRVNQTDCEGCGTCLSICHNHAIRYNKNGLAEIDQSKCLTCGYCAQGCPVRAIIMY